MMRTGSLSFEFLGVGLDVVWVELRFDDSSLCVGSLLSFGKSEGGEEDPKPSRRALRACSAS